MANDLDPAGFYLRPAFTGRRLCTVATAFAAGVLIGVSSYVTLARPPYVAPDVIYGVLGVFTSPFLVLLSFSLMWQSFNTRGVLEIRDAGVTVWPAYRWTSRFLAWHDIAEVRADTQDRSRRGRIWTTYLTFVPKPGAPAVDPRKTPREGSRTDYTTPDMGPGTGELRWGLRRASIPLAPLTSIPVEEIAAEIACRSDVPFIDNATTAGTARQRRRAASRASVR